MQKYISESLGIKTEKNVSIIYGIPYLFPILSLNLNPVFLNHVVLPCILHNKISTISFPHCEWAYIAQEMEFFSNFLPWWRAKLTEKNCMISSFI
jgi:hypothetical protein